MFNATMVHYSMRQEGDEPPNPFRCNQEGEPLLFMSKAIPADGYVQ